MNILEQEDIIKGLPDAALMKEASAPSGQVPQFLVVSEIKRRSDMRKRFEQQQQPQGTVKDQIVTEAMGIAPMMPTAMTPPAQPMGPAGPPPNRAMPPPMGGMPPQGAPPMAPPMPQGGIASAPQAMPPMGMAQGGIVRMQGGGFLGSYVPQAQLGPVQGGSTVKDQIDRLIDGKMMSAADILSFAQEAFYGQPEAINYVITRLGGAGAVSAPRPRMEEGMFGYSDRDARVMGTMEAPLPEREAYPPGKQGREAFSKAFTDTLESNDAIFYGQNAIAPDASETDQGIMANLGMPTREQGQAADRSRIERIRGKLSPPIGPMGAIDVDSGIASMVSERAPRSTTAFDFLSMKGSDFGPLPEGKTVGPSPFERLVPEGGPYARQLASDLNEIEDLTLYGMLTADEKDQQVTPPDVYRTAGSGAKEGTEETPVGRAVSELSNYPSLDESNPFMEQIQGTLDAARKITGDISVQGKSKIQTQPAPASKAPADADMPALDFSDLIADSKQQALANAMIQLGAGVASGDVSKGLAAAGTAAMKGTADARALDMKRRLAEYQAGREDIRRGDEASRFERQIGLQERKVDISEEQFTSTLEQASDKLDADIAKAGRVSKGQLLTFVADIVQESLRNYVPKEGESVEEVAAALSDQLLRKYAGFMDVDVSGLPTTTGGTQTGSRSREDILAQYNVAN